MSCISYYNTLRKKKNLGENEKVLILNNFYLIFLEKKHIILECLTLTLNISENMPLFDADKVDSEASYITLSMYEFFFFLLTIYFFKAFSV